MKMKRKPSTQNLSWSNSRTTLLEYCQKKYFLNYYTFALKPLNIPLRKTTLTLKKLKSIDMRMGEKTHFLISDYLHQLKRGPLSPETLMQLKENIAQEMRQQFELSKKRNYQDFSFAQEEGLSEHYYGQDIDDLLEPTIQRVWENLDAFIWSSRHERILNILATPHDAIYIEEPRKPDFNAMRVQTERLDALRHVNIMAAPDFWVVFQDNKYLILDRKSGRISDETRTPEDLTDQLKVYALKLLLKLNDSSELWNINIEAYEIYLPSMQSFWGRVKQADIDAIVEKIKEDTDFQKTFFISDNVLFPSSYFRRTTTLSKCEKCTFREVCEKLKQFE